MTTAHPTLYKKNVDTSIQVWWIEQLGYKYRTHSGKHRGAIVTSEWTRAQGKNIGRANETTPEEQATAEIQSAYTLKKKGGYRESVQAARSLTTVKPMLAYDWDKHEKRALTQLKSGGLIAQPKLDGIRCLASPSGLVSRKGNPIVAVPHIEEALKEFFAKHPHWVLDGELYNHKLKDDFPALVSLVKKQKPSKDDLKRSTLMEYHVYDFIDEEEPSRSMAERSNALWVELNRLTAAPIVYVADQQISSMSMLRSVHEQYLSGGYEGTILRFPDAPYQQKRTHFLLKYKDWVDHEYKVVSIHEGEGNRTGMAGYAVCEIGESTFRANIRGTREYLREVLSDKRKYEGGLATVIHTPQLTPHGKPRFPRVKVFHGRKRDL
jgi:DNA ligase-1